MTKKFITILSILTLTLISGAQICPAQEGDGDRDPARRNQKFNKNQRMQPSGDKGKAQEQRLIKILDSIGVKQSKAKKLAAKLKELNQERRTLAMQEMTVLKQIDKLLQADKPDRKKLKGLIREIETIRIKKIRTLEREFRLMEKYLTTEQYARMLIKRSGSRQRPGGFMKRGMRNDRRGGPDSNRSGGMRKDRRGPDSTNPESLFNHDLLRQ